MSQSGQQGEPSGRAGATRGRGANSDKSGKAKDGKSKDKKAAAKSTGAGKGDGPERPGASGHRFGPDLACSECGILWDLHQREPKPCSTGVVRDAFARRPAVGFDDNASGATSGTASGTVGSASKSEGTDVQSAAPAASAESPGSSDSATESTKND